MVIVAQRSGIALAGVLPGLFCVPITVLPLSPGTEAKPIALLSAMAEDRQTARDPDLLVACCSQEGCAGSHNSRKTPPSAPWNQMMVSRLLRYYPEFVRKYYGRIRQCI